MLRALDQLGALDGSIRGEVMVLLVLMFVVGPVPRRRLLVEHGMSDATETEAEWSNFAMTEAAMIRRALDDEQWADLLKDRPNLEPALEAYHRAWAAVEEERGGAVG